MALKKKFKNLLQDKRFSEIFKGSVFALGARIAATGLSLVTSIIVARFYGAAMTGTLAMVNSFLMLTTIFTVLGTNSSILRLIPEYIAKQSVTAAFKVYRKTQYLVVCASLLTGATLYVLSDGIAVKIFSKPQLSFYLAIAACFVIFKSLADLNTQAVRGLRLIKTFAFMQLMPSAVMIALLTAMTLWNPRPGNPVYAQLITLSIVGLAGSFVMNRAFKGRMHPNDSTYDISVKEILIISFPMLATASMHFFIGQTGIVILSMLRPEKEVGYYSIAVKLATLTTFVLGAINSMVAPKFSELFHSGKLEELLYVARKSARLIFWATVPILAVLVIFGHFVLGSFFGEEFKTAYVAMLILVVGQFVNAVSGSTGIFMTMTGQQNKLSIIISTAALMNIIFSILLIPSLGINGASIASMMSLVFWNIVTMLYIKKKYGKTIGYLPFLGGK